MAQNIFITGTNVGLGRLTAMSLLEAGHTVVATMRDIDSRNLEAAQELRAAGAHVVELDVTDDDSVRNAMASAVEAVRRLDVVINNAGVGSTGLLEAFTTADWQKSFDINVFGMQRVTRAALPFMRQQGSGLLIFISSMAGRVGLPFFGPYNAAKFAVEGLAETCRADLSSIGIQTCVIEPGPYATNFIDGLMAASDTSVEASYGELANARSAMVKGFEAALAASPDQDPQDVADAIVTLIAKPAAERQFRTLVNKMGMTDAVEHLNEQADVVAQGLYSAWGLADFLKLRSS